MTQYADLFTPDDGPTSDWVLPWKPLFDGPVHDVLIAGSASVKRDDQMRVEAAVVNLHGRTTLLNFTNSAWELVTDLDRVRVRVRVPEPNETTTWPVGPEGVEVTDVDLVAFLGVPVRTVIGKLEDYSISAAWITTHDRTWECFPPPAEHITPGDQLVVTGVARTAFHSMRAASIQHIRDVPELADLDELTVLAANALASHGWPGTIAELTALAHATTS